MEEEEDAEATPKEPADVVYRYRKFTLGKIVLVARCELHGFVNKSVSTSAVATSINIGGGARKAAVSAAVASPTGPTTEQYFSSYAFNEWDSKYSNGIPWKLKLDQQRSAVLATECKNNTCKVARWCAQSLLAGADLMKVGYVSRNNAQNNYDHSIVGTQTFKPKELSSQINLQPNNIWGIIKTIAEKILDQPEDGKFILMKDPMKSSMKLFKVPVSDESDEDSDESEEDSEESEEDSEESEEDSDEE